MTGIPRLVLYAMGTALLTAPLARAQDSTGQAPPTNGMRNPHMAGGSRRGGGHMGDRTHMLFRGITLSGTQRDSIQKLDAANDAATQQLWQSHPGDTAPDSTTRAQFRALRTDHLNSLRGVLTTDQQPTFDKNLADMQSEMRSRMQHGMGGAGGP